MRRQVLEACGADDASAIAATIVIDGLARRAPIGAVRIIERLSDGTGTYLHGGERDAMQCVGMPVRFADDGRYTAMAPVEVSTFLRAARH